MPRRVVVLAGDRAQVQNFEVLGERQHDLVHVGKLVARRIDEHAVRVALERPRRRVYRRRRLPRREHREIRVERPVVLREEHPDPAVELRLLSLLVQLFGLALLLEHHGYGQILVTLGSDLDEERQPVVDIDTIGGLEGVGVEIADCMGVVGICP